MNIISYVTDEAESALRVRDSAHIVKLKILMHRSLTTHLWEGSDVSSIHQRESGARRHTCRGLIRIFTIDNILPERV